MKDKLLPWLAIILLGLPMIIAGSAKLAGVPELHQSFALLGLPKWFGYFIGLAELAAGIAVFVKRMSALAALGLVPIMLGAAYFHVAYAVPSAVPALVFILLSLGVIYYRRSDAIWFPLSK